jgi:hypothetical protein
LTQINSKRPIEERERQSGGGKAASQLRAEGLLHPVNGPECSNPQALFNVRQWRRPGRNRRDKSSCIH